MSIVKQEGELLLGTREELERDIRLIVLDAGAMRGVLRFTEPAPWPGMPGKFYVRVTIVRPMERPAPPARRRSLVPWLVAGAVVLAAVVLAAAWLLLSRLLAGVGGVFGLVALAAAVYLAVSLVTGRRSSSTVTSSQVTYTRTCTRTR